MENKNQFVKLTSPAGGEKWSAGSLHRIMWNSSDATKNVNLEYSADSGQTWKLIAGNVKNEHVPGLALSQRKDSQFLWKIPDGVFSGCRVRVGNVDEPEVNDSTDSDFAIMPSQAEHNYRWTCITEKADFAARDGAGALVFKDKMWLLGGWNPKDKVNFPKICNNEVWVSTDGKKWDMVKPNTFRDGTYDPKNDWEGRHTAGYAIYKNKMWIVGGDCNQHHYQNDVWNSADGVKWEQITESVPWGPRNLHYTVVHNNKIWVMGGQTLPHFAPANLCYYNDVWNTSDGVQWECVTEHAPWAPRGMVGGQAVFNGRIWIIGGGTYDTPAKPERLYYNDVWSSADGIRWERHVQFGPWPARSYHDVAVFDDKLWLLEGANANLGNNPTSNQNDVWYSSDGVNWHELPDAPWKPRHAASVFVYNNGLWMVAGNNMFPDAWKLQHLSNGEHK